MKLFTLILAYSSFSLYLPACEKCQEDITNLISHLEVVQQCVKDSENKAFYEGEINGLKISRNLYRMHHGMD